MQNSMLVSGYQAHHLASHTNTQWKVRQLGNASGVQVHCIFAQFCIVSSRELPALPVPLPRDACCTHALFVCTAFWLSAWFSLVSSNGVPHARRARALAPCDACACTPSPEQFPRFPGGNFPCRERKITRRAHFIRFASGNFLRWYMQCSPLLAMMINVVGC